MVAASLTWAQRHTALTPWRPRFPAEQAVTHPLLTFSPVDPGLLATTEGTMATRHQCWLVDASSNHAAVCAGLHCGQANDVEPVALRRGQALRIAMCRLPSATGSDPTQSQNGCIEHRSAFAVLSCGVRLSRHRRTVTPRLS